MSFGTTFVGVTWAENDTKPSENIRQHHEGVWQQLLTLSRLEQRFREEANFPNILNSSGTSMTSCQELEALKDTLYRDIHENCILKTRQRYKKYLAGFPEF